MNLDLLDEYDLFVGAKIRELRRERGISPVDVAAYMLTSRQQLLRYEKGKNRIPIARVILAAERFGVPLAVFTPPIKLQGQVETEAEIESAE